MNTKELDHERDTLRRLASEARCKIIDLKFAKMKRQLEKGLPDVDDPAPVPKMCESADEEDLATQDKIRELEREYDHIMRLIGWNESRYRRPDRGISGLFSKLLAPTPDGMTDTNIDAQARETMASLPSYWLSAIATFLGVIGGVLTLFALLPQLFVSPLSFVLGAFSVSTDRQATISSSIFYVLAVIAVIVLVCSRNFLYHAAHEEEKWFRAGAENWTVWQRTVSCLAFGACHIINIIYPLATCLMLSLAGAVFMMTYLREHRRSGSTYRATMAATKLHARYNICAFGLIVALVLVTLLQVAM